MTAQSTPGPWLRMGHRQIAADLVIDRPIICEVYSGSVGNEDADANEALIAAAPELLDACAALVEWCDKNPPAGEALYFVQMARAAVAKATGSQS